MPLPVFTNTEKSPCSIDPSPAYQATQEKTKSETEIAAEKLYEERIEDEYAKREGGA